jgi:hypothetical protein
MDCPGRCDLIEIEFAYPAPSRTVILVLGNQPLFKAWQIFNGIWFFSDDLKPDRREQSGKEQ